MFAQCIQTHQPCLQLRHAQREGGDLALGLFAHLLDLRLLLGQSGFPRRAGLGGKNIAASITVRQPVVAEQTACCHRNTQQAHRQQRPRPPTQSDTARLTMLLADNNDFHETNLSCFYCSTAHMVSTFIYDYLYLIQLNPAALYELTLMSANKNNFSHKINNLAISRTDRIKA